MYKTKLVIGLFFYFFVYASQAGYFVFVNPSNKADPFWNYVTALAVDTAKDLNIRLEVAYSGANRIHQSDLIKDIASRGNKPKAVIFYPTMAVLCGVLTRLKAQTFPLLP